MFDGESRLPAAQPCADGYPSVWLQLQTRRLQHLPAFAAAIPSVIAHAKGFPGMIRFGFDIDWERGRFRTFGAFDSETSLRDYITDGAHGSIYRRLRGRLGEVSANYGTLAVTALPTTWNEVPQSCFTEEQSDADQLKCKQFRASR